MTNKQIGILIDSLAASQLSYQLMPNINSKLKSAEIDICYFVLNKDQPCIKNNSASVFNISVAKEIPCPLIATSVFTANYLKNCKICTQKVFYILDLELIKNPIQQIYEILKDESIIKICRSKDYFEYIFKNFEVNNIINEEIRDFEIDRFLEIINGKN